MINALLIQAKTDNKTANRLYNRLTTTFQFAGIDLTFSLVAGSVTDSGLERYNIFIFLVTPDVLQNDTWLHSFNLILGHTQTYPDKLLIPLTTDEEETKPFFQHIGQEQWLPLEKDPARYFEDINWMIDRIRQFATEHNLDMSPNLETSSISEFGNQFSGHFFSSPQTGIWSYWLIKINETTWNIKEFLKGNTYTFEAAHHNGKNQSDYEYFQKVRVDDRIFAFILPESKQVIALFRVTRPLYLSNEKKEQIDLTIDSIIDPPIQFHELEGLPFFERLDYEANEKLYPLDQNMAAGLLAGKSLVERRNTPTYQNQISTVTVLSTDIPDSKAIDQLDIMDDARAIACIIAFKEVQLPLSFGLFGNWGSGKSFFMQKVELAMKDFVGKNAALFCDNVVPIWFNSWHYSDANLWASLSSRIFDVLLDYGNQRNPGQLDSLFSQLHSTNQQVELARQKSNQATIAINSLSAQLTQNEEDIKLKVQTLENVKVSDIASKVLENEQVKGNIEEIRQKADFVKWEDLSKVKSEAEKIKSASGKISAVIRQAYSLTNGRLWKAVLIFFAILCITWYLKDHIDGLKNLSGGIKALIQCGTVALGQLLLFIGPAMKIIDTISKKLGSLGDTIKDIQKEEKDRLDEQLNSLKDELAKARADQAALKTQQDKLAVKKVLIEAEITDIASGKKVINFIESRVTDDRYVKSLGMISWVRKDFEQLDFLLKQQREGIEKPADSKTFYIDRIVLFIDDLDRCREETVV